MSPDATGSIASCWPAVLAPGLPENAALALCLFIGVGAMVYIMRFSKTLQNGSLPYFNGISMLLGVYFTGAYPTTAFTTDANLLPLVAAAWAILGGVLGAALGWFNVTITFPRPVSHSSSAHASTPTKV